MTREVARRLVFLLIRATFVLTAVVVGGVVAPGCYSGGGAGTDPPTDAFYFPVGLAVSRGGNALYVINSDFDLQWNGGTLQSYDLHSIRRDAARLIRANLTRQPIASVTLDDIPFVYPPPTAPCALGTGPDQGGQPVLNNSDGSRVGLGQACAPPVDTSRYVRSSVIVGAFATDLQLQTAANGTVGHRLFAPVRGDATLTWADVEDDDPTKMPPAPDSPIFKLQCGQGSNGTSACGESHRTGANADDLGDTRHITLPGEPFGMAQTPDGTAIAITHQTQTETSLMLAGSPDTKPAQPPSMQFVVNDVENAGKGIVAVPHDPHASVPPCPPSSGLKPSSSHPPVRCVNPAFLETNGASSQIDLLRYYDDDGSTLNRPFLVKEAVFPFSTNLSGTDSRGIAIDPTPRLACKAKAEQLSAPDDLPHQRQVCGELPARVFFANRTPSTLVLATIGGPSTNRDGTYDPDLLTFGTSNIPLPPGPSRVYVAPVVNLQHQYELRVFVVNFLSSTISVYNPNAQNPNLALVDTIFVGPGPFAMAFDPFSLDDVARQSPVASDPRYVASDPRYDVELGTYRFAYVASFTQSYVQVIDLDESQPTFESVVFTLGKPTPPKGS